MKIDSKGFTLVEIIVTIVAAGILGAIFINFVGTALTSSWNTVEITRDDGACAHRLIRDDSRGEGRWVFGVRAGSTFVPGDRVVGIGRRQDVRVPVAIDVRGVDRTRHHVVERRDEGVDRDQRAVEVVHRDQALVEAALTDRPVGAGLRLGGERVDIKPREAPGEPPLIEAAWPFSTSSP